MTQTDLVIKREMLPALEKRGIAPETYRVLKNTIFPGASDEMVCLAWDYCKARKLDVLKKPVHIVPVWDSKQGRMRDTIWQGISELRTTAQRTGQYAGKDAPEFGQDVTKRIGSVEITFPEWCSITIYRLLNGERVAYRGSPVYWEEAYATSKDKVTPNAMWKQRPRGQLIKCAEAAALREAFPEEIGSDYCAEEMAAQGMRDVTARPAQESNKNLVAAFSAPPEAPAPEPAPAEPAAIEHQEQLEIDMNAQQEQNPLYVNLGAVGVQKPSPCADLQAVESSLYQTMQDLQSKQQFTQAKQVLADNAEVIGQLSDYSQESLRSMATPLPVTDADVQQQPFV